jgi:hypothetical protein
MGKRKGLTLSKTRSRLYKLAQFLGDANAVKRGKVGRRIASRVRSRVLWQLLGRLFK